MKIKLISDEAKKSIEDKVLDVLKGKVDILELDSCPPNLIVNYLEKLGVDIDLGDDMESNGWEWDYWIQFKYDGNHYSINGNGYYGGLKLCLNPDYEEGNDNGEEDNKDNLKSEGVTDLLNQLKNLLNNN